MDEREDRSLAVSREAERRFARWDGGVFDEWVQGPVTEVWDADPARGADLLRLVAEGVGLGALGSLRRPPCSWLDGLLRGPVPGWLAAAPPEARAALLVRVWNLGEGAAREAPWIDRFLLARISALRGEELLDDVVRELGPLLDEAPPCPWTGPFQVTTLDLRPADPRFLPGKLQVVAPRVVAVTDRRRDAVLGLLLGPGPLGVVLGPLDPVAPTDPLPGPAVGWDGELVVESHRVALPGLAEPLDLAVAPAGYVVASAVNSQRLWIVAHA